MWDACIKAITILSKTPKLDPANIYDDACKIIRGAILDEKWLIVLKNNDITVMCGKSFAPDPRERVFFVHSYDTTHNYIELYDGESVDAAVSTFIFEVGVKPGIKSVIEMYKS